MSTTRGYITLLSVLVIGMVLLTVVVTVTRHSLTDAELTILSAHGHQAALLAKHCAEHALLSLKTDYAYQGMEDLVVGEHTCSILAVQGTGNEDRVIQTVSVVHDTYRRVEVQVAQISPTVITLWHTVADF